MIRFLALFFCLAACAGGPGAGLPDAQPLGMDQLTARVTAAGRSYAAALPDTGTARYHGLARLNLPSAAATQPYQGDLALVVAFGGAADPLTGTISGLQGPGGALTGDLQINGGTLFADAQAGRDYQFSANLAGQLGQGGQTQDLTAALSGDFYGTTGDGMAGVIYRGVIRQGDEVDVFDGVFAAERNGSGG
ncbi:MAG: hypothetical protein II336_03790 [Loktanella sp.]|nr:hypothetical protein [Loktanella sp.]